MVPSSHFGTCREGSIPTGRWVAQHADLDPPRCLAASAPGCRRSVGPGRALGTHSEVRKLARQLVKSHQPCGSASWAPVDLFRNPISLDVSVIVSALSSTRQIDLTMDDPEGVNPNHTLNPGAPGGTTGGGSVGGKNVTVLGSSAFGGPGATSSAWSGILTGPFAA